jgi:Putative prokaryotic signal transducing protein
MAEPLNPAGTESRPNPNQKLVKVFDSEDDSEAIVVKGLLDSAGIDCDLTAAAMVQDTFPGLGGTIILVREEDADAARKLLAEYRQPSAADDAAAGVEATEEPQQ